MEAIIIGNNLRRLRLSRELTQEELARAVSVSPGAYRNYETGKAIPRVNKLLAIARHLGVGLNDLVAEPRRLSKVRFRADRRLNTREQILIDVANWLEDFAELEEITGDRCTWELGGLQPGLSPVEIAEEVRRKLKLKPSEPIRDICGLLESCGVKVLPRPVSSEYFFGLAVGPGDGGPAVVVNTWERIPVERWIFSAAHEFGHLLLHLESFHVEEEAEDMEQEAEANQFASHFLMPGEGFQKEWEETAGLSFLERVLKLKRIYRVSYATVLYRLHEMGYRSVWEQFQVQHQRRYGHTLSRKAEPRPLPAEAFQMVEDKASREPKRLEDVDFTEDRLSRLARMALERELITRDRAAEILRLSPDEMVQRVQEWVV